MSGTFHLLREMLKMCSSVCCIFWGYLYQYLRISIGTAWILLTRAILNIISHGPDKAFLCADNYAGPDFLCTNMDPLAASNTDCCQGLSLSPWQEEGPKAEGRAGMPAQPASPFIHTFLSVAWIEEELHASLWARCGKPWDEGVILACPGGDGYNGWVQSFRTCCCMEAEWGLSFWEVCCVWSFRPAASYVVFIFHMKDLRCLFWQTT